MHTRSTYLQIKPGRKAILKNTRNDAKLQKDYAGIVYLCLYAAYTLVLLY